MPFKHFYRTIFRLFCLFSLTLAINVPAYAQSCEGKRLKRSQTRIVGGWRAKIKHWPGQAVFRLRNPQTGEADYVCGGTAIAPHWILTAAHCIEDIKQLSPGRFGDSSGNILEVQIGTDNLKSNTHPHTRQIAKLVPHKKYRNFEAVKNGYDIALIKLKTPWSGPFARLSMIRKNDPSAAGSRVMVAGFGLTKGRPDGGILNKYQRAGGGNFYAGSDILLQTAVPTVGNQPCITRHRKDPETRLAKVSKGQLCAGLDHGGKDSCNGDSGGPLVAHTKSGCPYQIGIVSWGPQKCGGKKSYGVYTRISHFSGWIKKHVPEAKAIGGQGTRPQRTTATLSRQDINMALRQIKKMLGSAHDKVQLQMRVLSQDTPAANNRVSADEHYLFDISSQIDGQLILVDIDEDGVVTQIFPNKHTISKGVGKISAGKIIQVPDENYGFDAFRAEIPASKAGASRIKGKLIAFVVPENFRVDQMVGAKKRISRGFVPEKIPTNYLMNLVNQISSLWSVRTTGRKNNKWAYTVMNYEIVDE